MAALPQPVGPLTEAELNKVTAPADIWDDSYALKIAKADFEESDRFYDSYHSWRHRNSFEIYVAWCAQKYWQGTKIPRSSLSIYLALQQIEAFLPHVVGSIFGDDPWCEYDAMPGTPQEMAQAAQDLEVWQTKKQNLQEAVRRSLKSACIFGNGPAELCMDYREEERWRPRVDWIPQFRQMNDALLGQRKIPYGKKRVIRMEKYTDTVNMPKLRNCSVFDFRVDPNATSPNLQDDSVRFVAEKRYMTIEELECYRKTEGFKIPPRMLLVELAKNKPGTMGDVAKSYGASLRGEFWDARQDYTSDTSQKRIEVIVYTTRNRKIWLANRLLTIFNQPNPYGFINYFSPWYVDVPERHYAMGICDLVEGEQRLIQAIRNGRIDELALNIYSSTIKRRGAQVPQSQLIRRPGNVI